VAEQTITITIHPSGGKGRPLSVEDAMNQILDVVHLLEVPARVHDASARYEWAVVGATTNSPLQVTVAPYGSVENSTAWIAAATEDIDLATNGLIDVFENSAIPLWLDAKATNALKRLAKRNTNGLGVTEIISGDGNSVLLDPAKSQAALNLLDLYTAPSLGDIGKHRARGEVSGRMVRAGEYHHRPAFWLKDKTGAEITCTLAKELIDKVGGETTLQDIWKNRFLVVRGVKSFDASGKLVKIEVTEEPELRDLRPVNLDTIIDEDFTSGIDSVEYLRQIRGES
jgi:hypothetical protein